MRSPSFPSLSPGTPLLLSTMSIPYVGIASISLAASLTFGVFKFFSLWERVQRSELANTQLSLELRTAEQGIATRDAELQLRDETISSLRQENEKSKTHITTIAYALQSSESTNRELARKSMELEGEVKRLSKELESLRKEHRDAQDLLNLRAQELTGAQAFLTKADTLSGGDVINMVETLNAEIMQLSAHMAESFSPMFAASNESGRSGSPPIDELTVIKTSGDDDVPFPRTESPEEIMEAETQAKDAMAQALEVFGPTMVDYLQKMDHSEDPILLQFAFQAGLSAYTHWIISSWFFEDPEDEVLLSEVYARVREAEEQSVSGRWRALTRVHVQRMMRSTNNVSPSRSPSPDVTDLVVYMVDALVNVLLISGLNKLPKSNLHTHTHLHSKITTAFSSQLHVILSHAKKLNNAVGEYVTSCDLEALYIAPDVDFNGTTMEDATGQHTPSNTPKKTPERVLCTTDLGLVRAEKIPGTRGEWNESVLLKPKVVLISGLEEIMNA